MPKYEFEVETVKKRRIRLNFKSLDDARRLFDKVIEQDDGDEDSDLIWNTIYDGEIIEDERIVEVKNNNASLIKKGEVVWNR